MFQGPPIVQAADPTGLPQEKLPKDLKEKMKFPGPWQGGGMGNSTMLIELLERGTGNSPRPPLKGKYCGFFFFLSFK